jgi:ribosomal protein S27AE
MKRIRRKIAKILRRGELSKFDNYDTTVELECGHRSLKTFHRRDYPVGKVMVCSKCGRLANDPDRYGEYRCSKCGSLEVELKTSPLFVDKFCWSCRIGRRD